MRKLERMVAAEPDLQICGSAATCADAIRGMEAPTPQLAILDIRLPDGTGFEILQALEEPRDLQLIFLTAYDDYAVQAFSVAAIDYLLKPVSQERFSEAIGRVRWRLASPLRPLESKYARRFLVERRKALIFFRWIRSTTLQRITTTRTAIWASSRCEPRWMCWKSAGSGEVRAGQPEVHCEGPGDTGSAAA